MYYDRNVLNFKGNMFINFSYLTVSSFSNIDTNELCTYFSQHLGEFKEIFGLLEEINRKMTNMLYGTAKVCISLVVRQNLQPIVVFVFPKFFVLLQVSIHYLSNLSQHLNTNLL